MQLVASLLGSSQRKGQTCWPTTSWPLYLRLVAAKLPSWCPCRPSMSLTAAICFSLGEKVGSMHAHTQLLDFLAPFFFNFPIPADQIHSFCQSNSQTLELSWNPRISARAKFPNTQPVTRGTCPGSAAAALRSEGRGGAEELLRLSLVLPSPVHSAALAVKTWTWKVFRVGF